MLTLAACGGGSSETGSPSGAGGATGGSGPGGTGSEGQANLLPAVDVVDVASGETVALASLLPADRPVLLWMWAPH